VTVRGKVHGGMVVLADPLPLADGTEVEVEVRPVAPAAAPEQGPPTVLEELQDLAGTVEGLPADVAENHDHYLYGTRKK
jgi:hypothetical protein